MSTQSDAVAVYHSLSDLEDLRFYYCRYKSYDNLSALEVPIRMYRGLIRLYFK